MSDRVASGLLRWATMRLVSLILLACLTLLTRMRGVIVLLVVSAM